MRHTHTPHTDGTVLYRPLLPLLLLLLRQQIPQRQIVDNVLHVLDPIFETIAFPAQYVVLQIEDLEAGMDVLDELIDEQRTFVVAERDGIARETSLQTCQDREWG